MSRDESTEKKITQLRIFQLKSKPQEQSTYTDRIDAMLDRLIEEGYGTTNVRSD